ncbi:restriction endonuclease subunit S [Megasphaera sp. DISK 18]|uniref:restriction endonuclease subunit S n=1 Tax=Megasphaera sp. DISK 18 TaxID=1776081 RepID=UPI0009F20A74
MNKNLFIQAQSLYRSRFIDFYPFNGALPKSWNVSTVSEIIDFHDSKRIPLSNRERAMQNKIYPYYGAASIVDYVEGYLFDGIYLLLGEDGSVVDDKGFPVLQYVEGKFWANNHTHIITGKNGFSTELVYLLFSLTNMTSVVTGAVQSKISQTNLNKVPVVIPPTEELKNMNAIIQPFFSMIRNLRKESGKLVAIRNSLLKEIMSGEIDISSVDI